MIEVLAHHGLLLAIPAFAPAVAVAGVSPTSLCGTDGAPAMWPRVRTRTRHAKMVHRDEKQNSSRVDGRCTHHRWMRWIERDEDLVGPCREQSVVGRQPVRHVERTGAEIGRAHV